MYWKIEALTANRTYITQIIEGSLEDIEIRAVVDDLEILSVRADYGGLLKSLFQNRKLSSSVMAIFFNDFSDMHRCGLSVHEAMYTLQETTSHPTLKKELKKIGNFINDGRSLQEAFEYTGIFPKIVSATLSAAEKSGNIPELLDVLTQYFKFNSENKKKIVQSLVYPLVIFCLLSGVSVFISVTLVPQLKTFLPASQAQSNLSACILTTYAGFIKEYWWTVLLFLALSGGCVKYSWHTHRERLMETVFKIPMVGSLMRNIELSQIFFNMYVYERSGINIIEAINNIHQASPTYITDKLLLVRDRIFKGASLGDAFKQDRFFPPFVYQSLTKGQVTGFLPQYFERMARYYDIKTKESIASMIAMVEPTLMMMAASFLLMIVWAFILPIYTNMAQMGAGVFK